MSDDDINISATFAKAVQQASTKGIRSAAVQAGSSFIRGMLSKKSMMDEILPATTLDAVFEFETTRARCRITGITRGEYQIHCVDTALDYQYFIELSGPPPPHRKDM